MSRLFDDSLPRSVFSQELKQNKEWKKNIGLDEKILSI